MSEYPIILAHNVLDGGIITASSSEVAGHELDRLRDGHRHTWWQAPGTAAQYIYIRAKNLITNYGFETDLLDWFLVLLGSGAGTMSRNTTTPISGVADCKLMATTASDSADKFIMAHWKPVLMRAGRTYRLMLRGKAVTANKSVRIGFIKPTLQEDGEYYHDETVTTDGSGHYIDVAPAADGWWHPYVRLLEAGTVYVDDFVCNEARSIDTLIVDKGHTFRHGEVGIGYRNEESLDSWAVASEDAVWLTDNPVYRAFTGVKSLSWRIKITVSQYYGNVPVAKAPLLYLGQRWTMPHYFSGSFDPHREERFEDAVISERGIAQHTHKYNQRVFQAAMSHLTTVDYENVKKFFADTDNGAKPFFFAWKPDSDPDDIICMRLKGARNVPYTGGVLRQWGFEAEEVVGYRKV